MSKSIEDWRAAAASLNIDTRPVIAGSRTVVEAEAFHTTDPWRNDTVATYPDCGAADVDRAVSAARQAFEARTWADTPSAERAAVLNEWADAIETHAEALALMDSLEMGMPITNALDDIAYSAGLVREVAGLLTTLTAPAANTVPGTLSQNVFEALGVVAAITPWNFPVNQVLTRIVPAIAMGNAVVLKPSEIAPASALYLADLAQEAGLPNGQLSVLPGTGPVTGAALVSHSDINKIAFTGSTRTGGAIQAMAARAGQPKPLLMELGGKSPHIVCQSFDAPEELAPVIAHNAFWNTGQVCSAGTRLIVHESRADSLVEALCRVTKDMQPGDPLDPATKFGPIASSKQAETVAGFVQRAKDAGLEATSGDTHSSGPVIFDRVPVDAEIAREEIFGPVLGVSRFETLDEAIALANASAFGLVATAWTRDLNEAHTLARKLRAGSVTVHGDANAGGDFSPVLGLEPGGRSGFGADYGHAGLTQFAQLKLITFNTNAPA
ncbi:MAG: aldehyde dehydrogenase family protein [Pseudomonadota bacterium]